jgi:hypothetical protein
MRTRRPIPVSGATAGRGWRGHGQARVSMCLRMCAHARHAASCTTCETVTTSRSSSCHPAVRRGRPEPGPWPASWPSSSAHPCSLRSFTTVAWRRCALGSSVCLSGSPRERSWPAASQENCDDRLLEGALKPPSGRLLRRTAADRSELPAHAPAVWGVSSTVSSSGPSGTVSWGLLRRGRWPHERAKSTGPVWTRA